MVTRNWFVGTKPILVMAIIYTFISDILASGATLQRDNGSSLQLNEDAILNEAPHPARQVEVFSDAMNPPKPTAINNLEQLEALKNDTTAWIGDALFTTTTTTDIAVSKTNAATSGASYRHHLSTINFKFTLASIILGFWYH